MKNFTSICAAALIAAAACKRAEPPKEETVYVDATGGLRLRSEPNEKSRILVTIPHRAAVRLLEREAEARTVAGKKGRWAKIAFEARIGWAFDAFLSASQPDDSGPAYKFYVKSDPKAPLPPYFENLVGHTYKQFKDYPTWYTFCKPNKVMVTINNFQDIIVHYGYVAAMAVSQQPGMAETYQVGLKTTNHYKDPGGKFAEHSWEETLSIPDPSSKLADGALAKEQGDGQPENTFWREPAGRSCDMPRKY